MTRPIAVDLFAGAGGLSLGFEQAGFDIMASVEIDPIHCAAHKYNFPMCKTICRSVVDITGEYVRDVSCIGEKDIDVVIGGAPCQGFSLIGKRALDDDRNKLVYHYVRLVLELKPKYFIFENVKGLTVGKHKQFLVEIMDAFRDGGYDVVSDYKVLNAADYGVPQDRRRLFLMGGRKGIALPSYPEPLSIRTTVGDAIGDIPDAEKYPELWERDWVDAKFGKQSLYSSYLHGVEKDPSDFSYPRIFNKDKLTSSLLTDHSDISRGRFVETLPDAIEPISRFKKLSMNGLCNTLRAGTASDRGAFTSPRPIHPIYPRVITVREAARLHSYPDWFRFHVTKWHGFRQVGNSVPPMLARSVGLQIMKVLGVTPKKPKKKIKLGDESLVAISMSDAASMFGVSSNVIAKRIKNSNKEVVCE
ncbi:DNA cytosine methyltransferase [Escherichia coli]|uniref:DNA cytosine methyltransferase n=1 Tax=Enterobacteriaceae TaxID=543 RepID=UPI000D6E80D8|nr:DNA cytosine methyltransferase [Escherichia coli]EAO6618590.1 DNA cytosine methyltransferase [Salmonella enterica]EHO6252585.1 DNA cytosine methyltransferase [Salmonella enterica subsp. enterica serovar Heidelberg]EKJ3873808.1 DNA cytosine methyltransferase [Salmonella enterica subsp. enterica serovar Cerro]HBW1333826.1 DNA cytosine methyltransferase [Klebsiella pneumoniae]EAP8025797.1 DNA cytosine methyltransferase [Salmonella enterica]